MKKYMFSKVKWLFKGKNNSRFFKGPDFAVPFKSDKANSKLSQYKNIFFKGKQMWKNFEHIE